MQTRVISSEHGCPRSANAFLHRRISGADEFRSQGACCLKVVQSSAAFLSGMKMLDPRYTLTERFWEYLQAYKKKHNAKGNGFGLQPVRTGRCHAHPVGPLLQGRLGSACRATAGARAIRRRWNVPGLWGLTGATFKVMKILVSDTQAYRQFGNAVVVLEVVSSAAEAMKPYIEAALASGTNVLQPHRSP